MSQPPTRPVESGQTVRAEPVGVDRYLSVRRTTAALAASLSPEDACVQSMPSCSPAKWHLAHTTWFFETLVLGAFVEGFEPADPRFSVLFNSYYNSLGKRIVRSERGLMTRPSLDAVRAYRAHTDERMAALLSSRGEDPRLASIVEVGLQHEQQHQELLLMDVKHLFSRSPLRPTYRDPDGFETGEPGAMAWIGFESGVREIGADPVGGFGYDCEGPRHEVLLRPFELADRLVTNGEYMRFVEDGGYERPELWLDAGWSWVCAHGVSGPLYWGGEAGRRSEFTLRGEQTLDPDRPVCHVSFFEADAYSRWAGARLATEAEWETAAVERGACVRGNFVEYGSLHPDAPWDTPEGCPRQLFGDVWEWTRSDYGPYPGYRVPEGALGEYNGKFMCGRFVLRGGSCVTPGAHVRATYRNYFGPGDRWVFSGIRLARDAEGSR